ncbi:MAG TPA: hypothetical protein VEH81_08730, partial [Ktedonobacteraceae bacterium]|nr:hypothetical protein [Ktedonobacteraceae bacterium]
MITTSANHAGTEKRFSKESKVGGTFPKAMRYQPRTNIPEPEVGQTVHLPDITYPSRAKISQTDKPLSSHLIYNGIIAQKFDEPQKEFGLIWPYDYKLTDAIAIPTDTHW